MIVETTSNSCCNGVRHCPARRVLAVKPALLLVSGEGISEAAEEGELQAVQRQKAVDEVLSHQVWSQSMML